MIPYIYIYIYYLKWNYVKYCEISHSLCIQPYAFLYRMTFLHIPPTQGQDLPPQSQLPQQPVFFIAKNRQQLGILRNLTIITWFLYVENYQLSAGLHEQNTWIFERFERKLDWNGGFPPISGLDTDSTWFNNQNTNFANELTIKIMFPYTFWSSSEKVFGVSTAEDRRMNHGKSWQIMANTIWLFNIAMENHNF